MDDFPQGLRVLVVDDDFNSLSTLERLFQASHYQVTTCQGAKDAICILRGGTHIFDIVLTEIYMQEMDGFHLLQVIRQEMDYLPVVMMSSDGRKEVIMKGVNMGACDILLKPIRIEEISVLWQHVIRKRKNDLNSVMLVSKLNRGGDGGGGGDGEFLNGSRSPVENCGSSTQERKEEELNEEVGKNDIITTSKKPRMIWTPELHEQFVAAVNFIGLANAVPKKILEHMKVAGLTRENVASHLQKYRIHLQRKKEKKFNRDEQYHHSHPPQVVTDVHNQIDYVSPIHHFPISQTTSIVVEGCGGGGDQHAIGVSSSIYHHHHHHHHRHHNAYNYQTFSESSSTYEAIRYQETCQGMQRIEGEQSYNHNNMNNNNNEYINSAAYYAIPMAACATTTMIEVTEEDDTTKYDQAQETLQQQHQQHVEYHHQVYPYDHHFFYPAD